MACDDGSAYLQRERQRLDQVGRIHLVIPAYNEAATITDIVRRCRAVLATARIIVVDDGSCDGTAERADTCGATVLRHARNLGKGASLADGMLAALADGARFVVTLDGDGQHRPEDLPRLLTCSNVWPDHIVIGSRRSGGHAAAPRARFIANRVADFWVSWAARHPIDDSQSGYRVYPAAVLQRVINRSSLPKGFAFESALLIEAGRLGCRTVAVDIPSIYAGVMQRPSHFRPVLDITRIVLLVGGKLLAWCMDPFGLWQSLTLPRLSDTDSHLGVTPSPR